MKFGPLYHLTRKSLGLSQQKLALSVGVSQATLSRIETDAQEPGAECFIMLARLTDSAGSERAKARLLNFLWNGDSTDEVNQ